MGLNDFDENTIRQCLRFLQHKDGWTELRALDPEEKEKPRVSFCDSSKEKDIKTIIGFCRTWNNTNRNIYVGINPRKEYGCGTAENISEITTIIIDIDTVRPDKKQPSTQEELKEAEKVADKIIKDHTERGFRRPVKNMSGNGYQLWYAIPPINITEKNRKEIEEKLHCFQREIAKQYNNEHVKIDDMGDFPRIIKVIGTKSVKGKNTPERPHRLSYCCNKCFERDEDKKLREYILNLKIGIERISTQITTEKLTPVDFESSDMRPCIKKWYREGIKLTGTQRLIAVNEMLANSFTDEQIHDYFKKTIEGYDKEKTQGKINHSRKKGYKTFTCKRIKQEAENIMGDMCSNCATVILDDEKRKDDTITLEDSEPVLGSENIGGTKITAEMFPVGFIRDYMIYQRKNTDAPEEYHAVCALYILSVIVGRNVPHKFGSKYIYLNIEVLLLGKSRRGRKTTCINKTEETLNEVVPSILLPQESSPEGLIKELSDRTENTKTEITDGSAQGAFIRDEFGGWMADTKKQYMTGTKEFLMKLYDCPSYYKRTLKKETYEIRDAYVPMLVGTTCMRFQTMLTKDDILNGFWARFLFSRPEKQEWKPQNYETDEDMEEKQKIIDILKRIKQVFREKQYIAQFTDEAKKVYDNWAKKMDDESETNEFLAAFYGTATEYCVKLSTLIQAQKMDKIHNSLTSLNSHIMYVDVDSLSIAIKLCENFINYVNCEIGEFNLSEESVLINKVFAVIEQYTKKHGKIWHSELLRKTHLSAWRLEQVILTLKEREDIIEGEVKTVRRNKKFYKTKQGKKGGVC